MDILMGFEDVLSGSLDCPEQEKQPSVLHWRNTYACVVSEICSNLDKTDALVLGQSLFWLFSQIEPFRQFSGDLVQYKALKIGFSPTGQNPDFCPRG